MCWNVRESQPTPHWTRQRVSVVKTGESDNGMSADNQQESLNPHWIAGFTDGEGCFHVAVNELAKMTVGYQVLPEFRLTQHQRDQALLRRVQSYFEFGVVRHNHDDIYEFRVRSQDDLHVLIDFFNAYPLHTEKKRNLRVFEEILSMMNDGEHLTERGLGTICSLRQTMNNCVPVTRD